MNTEKAGFCIFCGGRTDEQHATGIGVVHIHSGCLADLQQVLSGGLGEKPPREEPLPPDE